MRRLLQTRRSGGLAVAAVLAATTLAACGGTAGEKANGLRAGGPSARVAFFLPRPTADRYEAIDLPYLGERLDELCPNCTLDYYNADQDQAKQDKQFAEALAKGPKVMVLDPVDSKKGAALIDQAKAKGVPVISYDRILWGKSFDYLVSFDHVEVGKQQGKALLDAMGPAAAGGQILWVNGPPNDANAVLMKKGAHEALDGKVGVAAEFTMPGPKYDTGVEDWLAKTVPTLDVSKIVGVYAVSDSAAGMVAKALKKAGVTKLPPITGSNADVSGLQRLLTGEQYMTAYKPIQAEARKAAEIAFEIVSGRRPKAPATLNNEAGDQPAFFVPTEAVTRETIKGTVLKDGYLTVNALCAAAYTEACRSAGISE